MIKTTVKEMTIYRDGAMVTRTGNLSLKQGQHSIEIEGLSSSMDPSTIRFFLPENVTGSNVQPKSFTQKEQEKQLQDLNAQLQLLESNIQAKQTQLELWKTNADFSQKDSLSISDMTSYIEQLPVRIAKIQEELIPLQQSLKELQEKKEDLQNQLHQHYLYVDLTVEQDGDYPFELVYFEPNASWTPFYEIHSKEDNTLTIRHRARIEQYTYEDITQAKVTLVTGNPSITSDIPELYPHYLHTIQPMRNLQESRMTDAFDGEVVAMKVMDSFMPTDEEDAVLTQTDTMMEYVLPGLITLEKDQEFLTDLTSQEIPCVYHEIAIPKSNSFAYYAAEVSTNDISSLLHTNAHIYHKGAYVGEIYIHFDETKDNYDISFGIDEHIKLKREKKKDFLSKTLLKGQEKKEMEYELSITSSKDKEIPIVLYDQIPVSQEKDIIVEVTNLSNATPEESNGQLKWEFDLSPQEKKTFTIAYTVSWPKGKQINL